MNLLGKLMITCLFFLSAPFPYAQEEAKPLFLNESGLTIDSLANVIDNEDIPYREKIALVYECSYKRDTLREKQIATLDRILQESKREKDVNGILFIYVYKADLYHAWEKSGLFKTYVDSAETVMEDATNPLSLARYHFTKGTEVINSPYGRKKGYNEFEKAIDYFNLIQNETRSIETTLYNITIYAANQPDTTSSKRIIEKVENILGKNCSPFIEFLLYSMKSDLYYERFDASRNEAMLDSAIHFEQERINIYNRELPNLPEGLDYDILQSYLLLAEYNSQRSHPDRNLIYTYIENAESFGYEDDYYISSRIGYVKALVYYGQKRYAEAENSMLEAEKLLDMEISQQENMYPEESYYSDKMSYADLHCKILTAQGKYREALAFNELKNDLKIKLRNVESREIEFLYNTEAEDRKIAQLKDINRQQLQSNIMLITVIALVILLIFLLRSWLKVMNKNFNNHCELISAEKREAEIKLKINEERAMKSLLERYEVLSDSRIKEIELEGKNREMEQLRLEKEALDEEIKVFSQKISQIEQKSETAEHPEDSVTGNNKLIIGDLIKFLNKKLPQNSEYQEALQALNPDYITTLKNAYKGNLSVPYIKYCLCFVIGMKISEIAEHYEIEPASVHVLRYRLKARFSLTNNDNLDDFLRNL
ncbi:MAG: hypothetical protein LBE91_13620 [Tannerella sp.]|jgi:hypothetical protein|nr:hypothetical protein [Tannerella sp.]